MKIVEKQISIDELINMSNKIFDGLVKAVVDVEKGVMVVDAEMHADQEELLLNNGSKQDHLWGINFYPAEYGSENFIEFDSMINLRPSQNNRSRGIDNEEIREKIKMIVKNLVVK